MKDKEEFYSLLTAMDGQPFGEYRSIIGDFDFSRYIVKLNRVPEDPAAPGVLFVVRVPQAIAGFPSHLFNTPIRRTALEDLLTRKVAAAAEKLARFDESGIARRRLSIATPGQKILPRSSLMVAEDFIEARLSLELPILHGAVLGAAARAIFFDDLPQLVDQALVYCNLDDEEVERFVDLMEDADQVRQALPTRGLIAFVGQGSRPDRDAGDRPAAGSAPLTMAEEAMLDLEIANAGTVRGVGIPTGVTVLVGDEYSGRRELMRALAAGIYNHVPGDGREFVITMPDAVYVSAEPGRAVQRVDVSSFVASPDGPSIVTTAHADALVSQAASTVEAIEVGARALFFDESDSAPSFLAADHRLAGLLGADSAVRPLASRVRHLADELGLSIVIGGSSLVADFLPVADTVLRIANRRIEDVTREAKALQLPAPAAQGDAADVAAMADKGRWVVPSSIDASRGRLDADIEALAVDRLQFGRAVIDLSRLAQLADIYQTGTIALILHYGKQRYLDEGRPIREVLDLVDRDLSTEGLECLSRDLRGDLARPRRYEIAAALNRLRTLRISHAME